MVAAPQAGRPCSGDPARDTLFPSGTGRGLGMAQRTAGAGAWQQAYELFAAGDLETARAATG